VGWREEHAGREDPHAQKTGGRSNRPWGDRRWSQVDGHDRLLDGYRFRSDDSYPTPPIIPRIGRPGQGQEWPGHKKNGPRVLREPFLISSQSAFTPCWSVLASAAACRLGLTATLGLGAAGLTATTVPLNFESLAAGLATLGLAAALRLGLAAGLRLAALGLRLAALGLGLAALGLGLAATIHVEIEQSATRTAAGVLRLGATATTIVAQHDAVHHTDGLSVGVAHDEQQTSAQQRK